MTSASLPKPRKVVYKRKMPKFRGQPADGLAEMGENDDEVWISDNLNDEQKEFVLLHERVHLRRNQNSEAISRYNTEELTVEFETIARASKRLLGQLFFNRLLYDLKAYLTKKDKLDPDDPNDLKEIYQRLEELRKLLIDK